MPEHSSATKWYALSVRYQHERQTESALQSKGLETLVPLYRSRRQWSDRVKDVDLPLFAGYVLCQFASDGAHSGAGHAGGRQNRRIRGRDRRRSKTREIADIQRLLASNLPLAPWPYLQAGDRVRVEHGIMRGSKARCFGPKTPCAW